MEYVIIADVQQAGVNVIHMSRQCETEAREKETIPKTKWNWKLKEALEAVAWTKLEWGNERVGEDLGLKVRDWRRDKTTGGQDVTGAVISGISDGACIGCDMGGL
jgi:hypothetical protein